MNLALSLKNQRQMVKKKESNSLSPKKKSPTSPNDRGELILKQSTQPFDDLELACGNSACSGCFEQEDSPEYFNIHRKRSNLDFAKNQLSQKCESVNAIESREGAETAAATTMISSGNKSGPVRFKRSDMTPNLQDFRQVGKIQGSFYLNKFSQAEPKPNAARQILRSLDLGQSKLSTSSPRDDANCDYEFGNSNTSNFGGVFGGSGTEELRNQIFLGNQKMIPKVSRRELPNESDHSHSLSSNGDYKSPKGFKIQPEQCNKDGRRKPLQKCSIITLFDVEPENVAVGGSQVGEPFQDADVELLGHFGGSVTPTRASQNYYSTNNQVNFNEKPLSLLGWTSQHGISENPLDTARSCASLFNHFGARENANIQEQKIHEYLDQIQVNQINVKQYIESLQRHESPNVQKLLVNKGAQPNLKERRRLLALRNADENQGSRSGQGRQKNTSKDRLSFLRLPNKQGEMSVRSSPDIKHPSFQHFGRPFIQQSGCNESQNRLKQLEWLCQSSENHISNEHQSQLNQNQQRITFEKEEDVEMRNQSSSQNSPMKASDQEMVDVENEGLSNSTRNFMGGLRPHPEYSYERNEIALAQTLKFSPRFQKGGSGVIESSSHSSSYNTCYLYQSPGGHTRVRGDESTPLQKIKENMAHSTCSNFAAGFVDEMTYASPNKALHAFKEMEGQQNNAQGFSIQNSLKKVQTCSYEAREKFSVQPLQTSNLNEIHESDQSKHTLNSCEQQSPFEVLKVRRSAMKQCQNQEDGLMRDLFYGWQPSCFNGMESEQLNFDAATSEEAIATPQFSIDKPCTKLLSTSFKSAFRGLDQKNNSLPLSLVQHSSNDPVNNHQKMLDEHFNSPLNRVSKTRSTKLSESRPKGLSMLNTKLDSNSVKTSNADMTSQNIFDIKEVAFDDQINDSDFVKHKSQIDTQHKKNNLIEHNCEVAQWDDQNIDFEVLRMKTTSDATMQDKIMTRPFELLIDTKANKRIAYNILVKGSFRYDKNAQRSPQPLRKINKRRKTDNDFDASSSSSSEMYQVQKGSRKPSLSLITDQNKLANFNSSFDHLEPGYFKYEQNIDTPVLETPNFVDYAQNECNS